MIAVRSLPDVLRASSLACVVVGALVASGPAHAQPTEPTPPGTGGEPIEAAVAADNAADAAPRVVNLRVQVFEGLKTGPLDKRLAYLKNRLPGFTGARLLDEIERVVEKKASVSMEILDKSKVLKVTVTKVEPELVRLSLAIEAFNFKTSTTHTRGNATVVVGWPQPNTKDPNKALFVAVSPRFDPPAAKPKPPAPQP